MNYLKSSIMVGVLALVGLVATTAWTADEPQNLGIDSEDYTTATKSNCTDGFGSVGYTLGQKIMDIIPQQAVSQCGMVVGKVFITINEWGKKTSWWPGSKVRPLFFGIAGGMNDKCKEKYPDEGGLTW